MTSSAGKALNPVVPAVALTCQIQPEATEISTATTEDEATT